MRTTTPSASLIALILLAMPFVSAQSKAAIEKKLQAEYTTTQATADQTDIVTAGSILVLKKGNIMMAPVSGTNYYQNTYKDGKITQNAAGKLSSGLGKFSKLGVPGVGVPSAPSTRTFVPGEKMWVTKIECRDDGLVFQLFTDAYADVRYKADLKFFFDKKGAMPSADEMDKMVAEVFKIQPADDQTGGGQQQQAPAAQAAAPAPAAAAAPPPAETPLAPIPPPPPPPDEPQGPPKTLKIGQSKDEVIANFGQPEKVVKLGPKEIYYYKDLGKVTFVNGKVTDVQ